MAVNDCKGRYIFRTKDACAEKYPRVTDPLDLRSDQSVAERYL